MSVRKETIGDATLYLGDCREVLPTLSPVDAVVTDPPYGIGIDGQQGSLRKNGTQLRKHHDHLGWDSESPEGDLFAALRRLSLHQIIWGGNYFVEHIDPQKGWLIWDKQQTGLTMSDAELAYTNIRQPTRIKRLHRTHLWQENPEHPTQKPVALMVWCLTHLPPEARTIIDPFMGSGTTGVACAHRGLAFIGIEREPRYFDIAVRRIEEAQRQGDLIRDVLPVAKPKQEGLGL